MKRINILIISLFIISISLILTGCSMKYRVFYNDFDGVTYEEVLEGETATYFEPKSTGYEFLGWYTEDDELFDFSTPIKKNINLYAYYAREEWTVTFVVDSNDEAKNITKKVNNGYPVSAPDAPVKDGYIFLGWTIDDVLFDFSNTYIYANTTITATFVKDEDYKPMLNVTLVFDASTILSFTIERLSAFGKLSTMEKPGLRFLGWYYGNELITEDTIVTQTEDFTLYAHYEKIE